MYCLLFTSQKRHIKRIIFSRLATSIVFAANLCKITMFQQWF